MGIKILSLNIEADKHLSQVIPLIRIEKPQVVTLMEVLESQVEAVIADYTYREFLPNVINESGEKMGVALGSIYPLTDVRKFYADGDLSEELPVEELGNHRPAVITAQVETGEEKFVIGATHFTWTPEGSVTEKQLRHLKKLLAKLEGEELILCGDFNMPRGNEAYQLVANRWKDNIPLEVESTIDPKLHRANQEEEGSVALMVDYIWSTPKYQVNKVEVKCGVSDHCGLMGKVEREM